MLISDQGEAPALSRARELGINALFINPKEYKNREEYEAEIVRSLKAMDIDVIGPGRVYALGGQGVAGCF